MQRTGSINRAAATAGLSYKGAWLLLERACNLANEPLLETATGGAGGGGTQLTAAARGLLAVWHTLQTNTATSCVRRKTDCRGIRPCRACSGECR